ncbi:alpha/beta fold hydrolase [Gordonia terrae]
MDTTESALPPPVYVDVDGARTATYIVEPPQRTDVDVVMCHGTPWSAYVWADVARHIGLGRRVFLWDMPGYGQSMTSGASIDLATQMSRFAQLQSQWGLTRPHVIAHDIGGAVALGAHLLHEREYASLFLWDVVTLDPWGSPFFRLVADNSDVFAQLPDALHAALVREYIGGAARHRLGDNRIDALVRPWLGKIGQPGFYRQIAALRTEDTRPVADRLAQVRCPTRIGWGADDPWIPVEQAALLQDLLPDRPDVVTLGGVGHLAPLEATAEVIRAIQEWLAAVT